MRYNHRKCKVVLDRRKFLTWHIEIWESEESVALDWKSRMRFGSALSFKCSKHVRWKFNAYYGLRAERCFNYCEIAVTQMNRLRSLEAENAWIMKNWMIENDDNNMLINDIIEYALRIFSIYFLSRNKSENVWDSSCKIKSTRGSLLRVMLWGLENLPCTMRVKAIFNSLIPSDRLE